MINVTSCVQSVLRLQAATTHTVIYFILFIKIHPPDKNIHAVNAVKQAENRLVEWPTRLCAANKR